MVTLSPRYWTASACSDRISMRKCVRRRRAGGRPEPDSVFAEDSEKTAESSGERSPLFQSFIQRAVERTENPDHLRDAPQTNERRAAWPEIVPLQDLVPSGES
jgi:hypothetical protein